MRDLLLTVGNVREENSFLLTAPTAAEVDEAAALLRQKLESAKGAGRLTLFVYFAGHGDEASLHFGNERYPRSRLDTETDGNVDIKIVIVDACRTLDTGRNMGVSAGAGFDVSIAQSTSLQGAVTIQSSQIGEPAHESDRLGGAVFSHHLMSALRGAADADTDGKVTLLEAYQYAYRGTVKDSARGSAVVQHPNFDIDLAGTEDFVMTTPAAASSRLVLSAEQPTIFQVFSLPYFSLVAEFTLSPHNTVTVAVPKGRLLIQRRTEKDISAVELKLSRGEKRVVSAHEYTPMSIDVTRRRGVAVDTTPNLLRLAALVSGNRFVDRWIPRFGGTIGYERRFRVLKTGIEIGATHAGYDTDTVSVREVDILAAIGIGIARTINSHTLGFSVGPMFDFRLQNRTKKDAARLREMGMGAHIEERLGAASFGGFLGATWDVTLTARLDFTISLRGSIVAVPMVRRSKGSVNLSPSLSGATGLSYRF